MSKRRLCIAIALLIASGLALLLRANRQPPRTFTVPILMYHKIGDADNRWWVSAEDLDAHMRFLRDSGYESILPSDLVQHRRRGKPLPEKPVIITFDDGYLDAMTLAEPILQKHNLRGIVFLITAYIADDEEGRRSFHGAPCLTWGEVRAMHARGTMAFGAHSRTHANLAALRDPYPEIRGSYEDIVVHAGFVPDAFCYPYGQARPETAEAVRRAGFTSAVICGDQTTRFGPETDLFWLPRVSVMGGRRRFEVEHTAPGEDGRAGFRVRYEGMPMEIVPRTAARSADLQTGWLPARRLGARDEFECRAPPGTGPDVQLEIWDRCRVLRLYTWPERGLEQQAPVPGPA